MSKREQKQALSDFYTEVCLWYTIAAIEQERITPMREVLVAILAVSAGVVLSADEICGAPRVQARAEIIWTDRKSVV